MGSALPRSAPPVRDADPRGAQAGLSWATILRKRKDIGSVCRLRPERVARFGARDMERLLADPGIVRNRLKVESTVANARAVLSLRDSGETLDGLLWGFVGGEPRKNRGAPSPRSSRRPMSPRR